MSQFQNGWWRHTVVWPATLKWYLARLITDTRDDDVSKRVTMDADRKTFEFDGAHCDNGSTVHQRLVVATRTRKITMLGGQSLVLTLTLAKRRALDRNNSTIAVRVNQRKEGMTAFQNVPQAGPHVSNVRLFWSYTEHEHGQRTIKVMRWIGRPWLYVGRLSGRGRDNSKIF